MSIHEGIKAVLKQEMTKEEFTKEFVGKHTSSALIWTLLLEIQYPMAKLEVEIEKNENK